VLLAIKESYVFSRCRTHVLQATMLQPRLQTRLGGVGGTEINTNRLHHAASFLNAMDSVAWLACERIAHHFSLAEPHLAIRRNSHSIGELALCCRT
jgi:hypothetical protein